MSLRLFLRIVSLEMRTRLSYRMDFWLNALAGFFATFGLAYFLWEATFRESGKTVIGGYDLHGMVVYYLAIIVLGRLILGREFEGTISQDIYEGGLNRYILFPARYFPIKYAQHVGRMVPAALPYVILGALACFFLDVPEEMVPGPSSIGMALGVLVIGNVLHFLISYPIQLVAFWADNVWSLEVAKRFTMSLLGGMMVPLTVFPEWSQPVLSALPFQFFFYFPARVLLGHVGVAEWAAGMALAAGWCVLFALVGWGVWRRGQLQYTGVGI